MLATPRCVEEAPAQQQEGLCWCTGCGTSVIYLSGDHSPGPSPSHAPPSTQGTTVLLAALASQPDLADRLGLAVLLAPVAMVSGSGQQLGSALETIPTEPPFQASSPTSFYNLHRSRCSKACFCPSDLLLCCRTVHMAKPAAHSPCCMCAWPHRRAT